MRFTLLLAAWLWILPAAFAADQFGQTLLVKTDDGAELHCVVTGPESSTLAPILFVPGYLMPADIFDF